MTSVSSLEHMKVLLDINIDRIVDEACEKLDEIKFDIKCEAAFKKDRLDLIDRGFSASSARMSDLINQQHIIKHGYEIYFSGSRCLTTSWIVIETT